MLQEIQSDTEKGPQKSALYMDGTFQYKKENDNPVEKDREWDGKGIGSPTISAMRTPYRIYEKLKDDMIFQNGQETSTEYLLNFTIGKNTVYNYFGVIYPPFFEMYESNGSLNMTVRMDKETRLLKQLNVTGTINVSTTSSGSSAASKAAQSIPCRVQYNITVQNPGKPVTIPKPDFVTE